LWERASRTVQRARMGEGYPSPIRVSGKFCAALSHKGRGHETLASQLAVTA
jgi:hypothetical protein